MGPGGDVCECGVHPQEADAPSSSGGRGSEGEYECVTLTGGVRTLSVHLTSAAVSFVRLEGVQP